VEPSRNRTDLSYYVTCCLLKEKKAAAAGISFIMLLSGSGQNRTNEFKHMYYIRMELSTCTAFECSLATAALLSCRALKYLYIGYLGT
jgi:hypothetical protein